MYISTYPTQNTPYVAPMNPGVSPYFKLNPYSFAAPAQTPASMGGDNTSMSMLMALFLQKQAASAPISNSLTTLPDPSAKDEASYSAATRAFEVQTKTLAGNTKKLNKYLRTGDKRALQQLKSNTSLEALTAEVDRQLYGKSVDAATRQNIITQTLRDGAEELEATNAELAKSHKSARKKYEKAKAKAKKRRGKWSQGLPGIARVVTGVYSLTASELKFLRVLPWNKDFKKAKHPKVEVNHPNESVFRDIVEKALVDNQQPQPNPWSTPSPSSAYSLGQTPTSSSQDALKQLFIQQMFASQAPTTGNAYSTQALYPQSAFL